MDRLLPLSVVARRLAVSTETVQTWAAGGLCPAPVVLPDGRPRWRASELAAWLASLPRAQPPAIDTGRRLEHSAAGDDLADLPELAREIVQVLEEAGPGVWLTGAEIARRIGGDCDHTSGYWRRCVRRLRDRGVVVASHTHGYRLAQGRSEGQTRAGVRARPGPE